MTAEEFTPTREESMRFFRARWEQRAEESGYDSVEEYDAVVRAAFMVHIADLTRPGNGR